MADCIRILHVFGTLGRGGAESRIIDLYRHMDRARVQFDFVVHYEADETGNRCPTSEELLAVRQPDFFDAAVQELGGRIYAVPRFKGFNLMEYRRAWKRLLEEHAGTWKMIQGHMTSTAAIYLPIAKAAGIPVTIAHARSAGTDPGLKGMMTRFIRRPLQEDKACDYAFACTREAGVAVFGEARVSKKDVVILPNAIEVDRFAFDEAARTRIRAEYGITEEALIGHVGRFHYAKNHAYLLRVFAQIKTHAEIPCKLMCVGKGGALQEKMKTLADELQIAQDVIFTGDQSDIGAFYSAFDCFCFPSRYEGLPGAVIEAQASGLPCLVSDAVTRDVDVTALVKRAGILEAPEHWAEMILSDLALMSDEDGITVKPMRLADKRAAYSSRARKELQAAGFDVNAQAVKMMEFYESGHFDT